jgi:hypothetical protein
MNLMDRIPESGVMNPSERFDMLAEIPSEIDGLC